MRWQNQRRSKNVENRRGAAGTAVNLGIVFIVLRFIFSRFGIAGVAVLVAGYFGLKSMGFDVLSLVSGGPAMTQQSADGETPTSPYDEMIAAVLGSTEDVWTEVFNEEGIGQYPPPNLTLFAGRVSSACGNATSAVGPFYCPSDRKVYIDTVFFDELQRRFRVPGDFPPAYVIAHEVGHHVQTVLGISNQVRQQQSRASQTESNLLQVRMELQADCLAGLWSKRARGIELERGDIQEAMDAAAAIGDDALQRSAGKRNIDTDSFTHGSSEQRMRWFMVGFDTGRLGNCDTFNVSASSL